MTRLALLLLLALRCLAQPEFDVASIKPSKPSPQGEAARRLDAGPTTLTIRQQNLRTIIQWAYQIRDSGELSGPAWMESEEFDITARAGAPATGDQLRLMLQGLLKKSFQLAVHRESKTRAVYALVMAKGGPKLQETKEESTAKVKLWIAPGQMKFVHTPMTMAQLADTLATRGAVDRPVLNKTGLTAVYDIDLAFACTILAQPGEVFHGCASDAPGDPAIPSIFHAVEDQLGLKLESQRGVVEVVVIDHIEKVPSDYNLK